MTLDVSGYFDDVDVTDVLTYSASGLPSGLSINATTGIITGTIANNASVTGPYSVEVTATDPQGATTTQTLTWAVTNPGPTATADSDSSNENSTITGNVLTMTPIQTTTP